MSLPNSPILPFNSSRVCVLASNAPCVGNRTYDPIGTRRRGRSGVELSMGCSYAMSPDSSQSTNGASPTHSRRRRSFHRRSFLLRSLNTRHQGHSTLRTNEHIAVNLHQPSGVGRSPWQRTTITSRCLRGKIRGQPVKQAAYSTDPSPERVPPR